MMRDRHACTYCGLPVTVIGRSPVADVVYCCYGCRLAAQITGARGETGQVNWMLLRLGTGIALSMAVMMFSLPTYVHNVYGTQEGSPATFSGQWLSLLRYLALFLSLPVFALLGLPIVSNAVAQAKNRIVSTDALVVVGVAAAIVYSYICTLTDSGGVYYETACTVLVLVTLGRYLEAMAKVRASDAIRSLDALLPGEVDVTRGGQRRTVPIADLQVGDLVHVASGQAIVVDGEIQAGRAHVDERLVTGEATPVAREVGHFVRAGTINLDGALSIRALAVGAQNTIGRIASLLEQAKNAKGKFGRLADRVSAWFVPFVVLLAAGAVILRLYQGSIRDAIMTGLAVLLISCPCALGIATPLAVWTALGRAAKFGILFKDAESMERLAKVRAVAFDKTGTLTTGHPLVFSFVAEPAADRTDQEWLRVAAGLGQSQRHALCTAIVDYGNRLGIEPAAVTAIRAVPGRGVVGQLEGVVARLGSPRMLQEAAVQVSESLQTMIVAATERAQSVACLSWNDQTVGVFEFSERLRPEATQTVNRLHALGLKVELLTGDHSARAEALARDLGIPAHANQSPADKLRYVAAWRSRVGPVVMVGDGLNDAPALAGADVGMAMGCGVDVSREAADVCLLGDDLRFIPQAIALARKTVRTIKGNLFWAFAYNMVGIPLALTGRLSPTFAALAMVISSLLVVTNSTKLRSWPAEVHT